MAGGSHAAAQAGQLTGWLVTHIMRRTGRGH